jgi:release factor glutamine methyltransferase
VTSSPSPLPPQPSPRPEPVPSAASPSTGSTSSTATPTVPTIPATVGVVGRLRAAGCVFAEDEADLLVEAADSPAELERMVELRVSGRPLEHVLGWAMFRGLRIVVEPGVFVPRRRTEFLVDNAVALARGRLRSTTGGENADSSGATGGTDGGTQDAHAAAGAAGYPSDRAPAGPGAVGPGTAAMGTGTGTAFVVVDLCCGSGALGAAVVAALRGGDGDGGQLSGPSGPSGPSDPSGPAGITIELHAADVDPAAVRCARRNLTAVGGHVHEGDLYAALPGTLRGQIEVLVANAPYVPTDAIGLLPPEARLHEPRVALDGGADGLDVLRRVTVDAWRWLAPGGHLLVETSERQAASLAATAAASGLAPRVVADDEIGATVVIATRPASAGAGTGTSDVRA